MGLAFREFRAHGRRRKPHPLTVTPVYGNSLWTMGQIYSGKPVMARPRWRTWSKMDIARVMARCRNHVETPRLVLRH